jgi:hypothetical protein
MASAIEFESGMESLPFHLAFNAEAFLFFSFSNRVRLDNVHTSGRALQMERKNVFLLFFTLLHFVLYSIRTINIVNAFIYSAFRRQKQQKDEPRRRRILHIMAESK